MTLTPLTFVTELVEVDPCDPNPCLNNGTCTQVGEAPTSNFTCTRGDQKVRGKVILNRNTFIDCNENSWT